MNRYVRGCDAVSRYHYCYKIVFGLVNVNFGDFFALSRPRCIASIIQKFFVDTVINVWNALPSTVNFTS